MKEIIELPILGVARRHTEVAYRVPAPVTTDTVRDLVRQKWCRRVQVSDSRGGNAEFRALCEIDGTPFVVTGEIGGQ
ncbi:hypothetical protein F7Q99_39375 [Streptomyces kaniharaensis]|uniref:Uncharacterized protein n=1 Tax=Streptomyces kaniharaensis TaxID=212423 RepID=A0A6N7L2K5_9ACTN|nr:hypothetical protein [Streptomyces kaniharaensis]MQS18092.1 hypothetical protein [Streptomyces kaniharaensis]